MSIQSESTRILEARNLIRNKLVELGLVPSNALIDALAAAVGGIENRGAVSAQVQEGSTYTIPKGYHNGSGTVSGVSGGGNYTLQSKKVTPTKAQQNVTPDSGFYGLSDVTVDAIPETYQDVSPVTAGAADVLANKIIVDKNGKPVTGTMANNGAVSKTLDVTTTSFTIPKGYHSGSGTVKITLETKTVTPTKSAQDVTPTAGKVLSKVTVAAIPDKYQDVSGVTAKAAGVLVDTYFVDAGGNLVEGTMPNNGALALELDGLTNTSVSVPAGYTSGGTVSLTDDIEQLLASI
jgi:hypothetical protein